MSRFRRRAKAFRTRKRGTARQKGKVFPVFEKKPLPKLNTKGLKKRKKAERPIVYGGKPIEYEEVTEGYGNVLIKDARGRILSILQRTAAGDLVDQRGNVVAEKKQIVRMQRHIRLAHEKVYPGTAAGQALREATGFAAAIVSGGMSAIVTPDMLYEVRRIMETEGYKETVKVLSEIGPMMIAGG